MNTARHYEADELVLFGMQLLSKDEMSTVRGHVAECPACRSQIAQIQGDLAVYGMTAEVHSPPALARERLMKQVAREKKAIPAERAPAPFEQALREQTRLATAEPASFGKEPPAFGKEPPAFGKEPPRFGKGLHPSQQVSRGLRGLRPSQQAGRGLGSGRYLDEEEERPKRNLIGKVFPWIGWAAAAGLAVAVGNLYHERNSLKSSLTVQAGRIDRLSAEAASAKQLIYTMTDPSARRYALTKAPAQETVPQPQGSVTYMPEKGTLVFVASNMETLQVYKAYELWLIPADGRDPIPAGTFHPDERGNASVVMPPLPKGVEAKAFGVTIEDDGGSQTPTMPIVMAGS
jgi:Anti-sigma-K factor rskA